jgi:hypothetical protein
MVTVAVYNTCLLFDKGPVSPVVAVQLVLLEFELLLQAKATETKIKTTAISDRICFIACRFMNMKLLKNHKTGFGQPSVDKI